MWYSCWGAGGQNHLSLPDKCTMLAMFACELFFGSCILSSANIEPKMPGGQPLIAAVAMLFSVALGIFTIRRIPKK